MRLFVVLEFVDVALELLNGSTIMQNLCVIVSFIKERNAQGFGSRKLYNFYV